ncbi:YbgA family protein [Candidatus Bipolaricaulota bacterium]
MDHQRPKVVFSRCLGFDHCRYNGGIISEPMVEQLKPFVETITVCPEVAVGLGIPRDPIRLVGNEISQSLIQPETGLDVTDKMRAFSRRFLSEIEPPDGFILKYASPSCGPREVKLYVNDKRGAASIRSSGMFAAAMADAHPFAVIEDEGRIKSFDIREHFLTRLFAIARFRQARLAGRARDLVAFHSRYKLVLMAYNQTKMRELGRIVANPTKRSMSYVFADYAKLFHLALLKAPRRTSAINVLMHGFGYVSDQLQAKEKTFFLDSLDQYRNRQVPLSVPSSIMRSLIIRFDVSYLADQLYFEPYPQKLVDVLDSGKGRIPK